MTLAAILAASLLFLAAKVNYVLVRNNHAEYSEARPESYGGLLALRSVAEISRKYTPNGNDPQLSLITIKRRRRKFTSLSVLSGPISTKNIRNDKGGGVMVYIRSDIPCRRVTDCETMSVELYLKMIAEKHGVQLKGHCPDDTYFLTYPTLARLRVQPVPIQRVAPR